MRFLRLLLPLLMGFSLASMAETQYKNFVKVHTGIGPTGYKITEDGKTATVRNKIDLIFGFSFDRKFLNLELHRTATLGFTILSNGTFLANAGFGF